MSWVVSEVLSNCRYVCSRCLSMLGHSGINIASGFSNIHLSTRACDFVYHICSHVQRYFIFYVEELPNSTTFIQNYNFKFCSQRIVPHRFINNFLKTHIIPDIRDSSSSQQDSISNVRPKVVFLNLPYLEDTTSKIRNTILGFIKRYDPLGTKLKIIILYKC